ncbi:MAG: ABC transporter ATP-binding protein [Betaproteobacteria bacterium]|nr:ABC transporter ATP-binding protein [Betaproteobacteria bacterium]MDH3437673.1 ABC transporter ATP-binding protein [Betaproteobacteria bacterium]
MLIIRELCKSYGGARPRELLRRLSLELGRGEYVAIRGESGAGKSTLLNLVAGLDRPDSGSIMLDGTEVTALDDTARTLMRRRQIGFVFQAFHLLPHLTVAQNVALPLALNGIGGLAAAERVEAMLEAVNLASAASVYPRELSGGEMQRVAIARALVHRPLLLLADEPTGNLDPDTAMQVLSLFRERVKSEGGTGILVTHSERAAATADRVLALTVNGLEPAAP